MDFNKLSLRHFNKPFDQMTFEELGPPMREVLVDEYHAKFSQSTRKSRASLFRNLCMVRKQRLALAISFDQYYVLIDSCIGAARVHAIEGAWKRASTDEEWMGLAWMVGYHYSQLGMYAVEEDIRAELTRRCIPLGQWCTFLKHRSLPEGESDIFFRILHMWACARYTVQDYESVLAQIEQNVFNRGRIDGDASEWRIIQAFVLRQIHSSEDQNSSAADTAIASKFEEYRCRYNYHVEDDNHLVWFLLGYGHEDPDQNTDDFLKEKGLFQMVQEYGAEPVLSNLLDQMVTDILDWI
jgi:hypothetical protein